jgi:hypothetical protein
MASARAKAKTNAVVVVEKNIIVDEDLDCCL